MVKHVILWQLKDELSAEEKQTVRENAKKNLESLVGKIDGLLSVEVNIDMLESSNVDMMLDTSFVDEASLKGYQKHPTHVEVANTFVRPFTKSRACFDYNK